MEMLTDLKWVQGGGGCALCPETSVLITHPGTEGSEGRSRVPSRCLPSTSFLRQKKFQISVCFLSQVKGFAFPMKCLLPRGIL